jgi:hypothetical protein
MGKKGKCVPSITDLGTKGENFLKKNICNRKTALVDKKESQFWKKGLP